jgi:hypothetical protein
MTRFLALVLPLLLPLPALSQEVEGSEVGNSAATAPADAETSAMIADGLEMPTEDVAPEDPVAVWQADPTAVLPADGIDLADFEYVARPLVIFGTAPGSPRSTSSCASSKPSWKRWRCAMWSSSSTPIPTPGPRCGASCARAASASCWWTRTGG